MSKRKQSQWCDQEFYEAVIAAERRVSDRLRLDLIALQNQNAAIRAEAESDAKQASNNWDAYTKMLEQRNREMEESARLRRLVSAIRQMAEVP